MPGSDYPLTNARAIVGAPVFRRLPAGLGVIVAVNGPEPNNLAHALARGRPVASVPFGIEVQWADGRRDLTLTSSVGDYDRYLEAEEVLHQARLERRARLPVAGLPIHRP